MPDQWATTRWRARLFGSGLVAVLVAGLAASCTPEAEPIPILKVTATEDVLGLSSRLVFSTAKNVATPARTFTVANTGTAALKVTGLTIAGTNPGSFKLRTGQATSFTVNPGKSTTVGVLFKPPALGIKQATLTVKSNDPARRNYLVALRGVNAAGTTGKNEASLANLVTTFGYTTNVGFTTVQQAKTRLPVGNEVVAPYFRRVDAAKPVRLVPIARYVAAADPAPFTGYQPTKGSATSVNLFSFPGDKLGSPTVFTENEKTFPTIAPGGTTSFNPTAAFGIMGEGPTSTDDQFNRAADGVTTYRSVRTYPAKGQSGTQIANTWIVAVDSTDSTAKNFDYQDIVLLLTNATPDPTKAPASATLTFDAAKASTIADRDGEGTGFTSVQPNAAGDELQPAALDLTGGTLRVTSGPGTNEGETDTQVNALAVAIDASRSNTTVRARLVDPLADLTLAGPRKGIWFGPGSNDHLSVVVERRDTGTFLTVRGEQDGVSAVLGEQALTGPVSSLDLVITTDLVTGSVQASAAVDGGAEAPIGTSFVPTDVMSWFSPQGRAGVVTSHGAAAPSVVAVFDSFSAV
jgi:hypothetical protein